MILIKKAATLRKYLDQHLASGQRVGFVPTMGALHEGHLSLVETAKQTAVITVVSIFVNPTQFNDPEDFHRYPVTIEKDVEMLEGAGADILFLPVTEEIYPDGLKNRETYQLGYLETILEGKSRPGHFQGVCQVMDRLLQIVHPDFVFMGSKDYQQCMVVKTMMELKGFNTQLVTCPIRRELNGLAMSSRNMRLSPEQRDQASTIYKTLCYVRDNIKPGPVEDIRQAALGMLNGKEMRPDYLQIADAISLLPVEYWDGKQPLVILAAAFCGNVRLIDNLLMGR